MRWSLTNRLLIPGKPDQPFTPNTLADPAKAVTVLEQVAKMLHDPGGSVPLTGGYVDPASGSGFSAFSEC